MTLLMVLVSSSQLFAQQDNGKVDNDKTPTNDPIYLILIGECEEDFPRSLNLPFEAFLQDGQLTIGSLADLSDVTVTLYSDDTVMYTLTRDFFFMDSMVIPVGGYPSGGYTLLLTTPGGTYIHGTFTL